MRKIEINSRTIASNTLLNLLGKAMPLLIGAATIPFLVRGFGTERFGLLSLAWMLLSVFTVFDLGLGRATTKYVAEAWGKADERQIPKILWTTATLQGIFGLAGALVLVGITPQIVDHWLNIPFELREEAKNSFQWLAMTIPVMIVYSSFSGVLQATQRFDLDNAIRIPVSTLTFIMPLIGLLLGLRLPGIMVLILLSSVVALLALMMITFRILPVTRTVAVSFALLPKLFSYGVWVMVSNIVNPILVYWERFTIGSLLTMTAVAYYTAPAEAVTRLWVIPFSLTTTLFPAFSTLEGIGARKKLEFLFARSVKYTVLVMGPIILVIMLFSEELLQLWLGRDFAVQSSIVVQILALGVLVNSLAQLPYALLQGVGRPDIVAKLHLLELPFYLGITWFLVSQWGITGAATAWTLRVALDALLLYVMAFKVCRLSDSLFATNGLGLTFFVLFTLAGISYGLKSLTTSLPMMAQALIYVTLFGLFAGIVWRSAFDDSDRKVFLGVVQLSQGAENEA